MVHGWTEFHARGHVQSTMKIDGGPVLCPEGAQAGDPCVVPVPTIDHPSGFRVPWGMRPTLAALVLTACTSTRIAPDVHSYVDAGGDVVPGPEAGPVDAQPAPDAAPPALSYSSSTATCSIASGSGWYAVQDYAGASADELAGVTAWANVPSPDAGPYASFVLPGYVRAQLVTQVRDGSVAVRCLQGGDVVTFVRVQ